jgi:hypothetical protein
MPAEPAVVDFGADNQHKRGSVELIEHPARPAFSGGSVDILVNLRIEPILTEPR